MSLYYERVGKIDRFHEKMCDYTKKDSRIVCSYICVFGNVDNAVSALPGC